MTDSIFRFSQISIGTRNLKKNLNTRSDMTAPFKPPGQKKLILKIFINLGRKTTWPQGVDDILLENKL